MASRGGTCLPRIRSQMSKFMAKSSCPAGIISDVAFSADKSELEREREIDVGFNNRCMEIHERASRITSIGWGSPVIVNKLVLRLTHCLVKFTATAAIKEPIHCLGAMSRRNGGRERKWKRNTGESERESEIRKTNQSTRGVFYKFNCSIPLKL